MPLSIRPLCATVLCLALVAWSAQASAHRANIFAWAEGDVIKVECSFSGGKPAMNAPIQILDAATDKLLAEAKTDDKGLSSFPIPAEARAGRLNLKLMLKAGEGHLGEWVINADEYLGDVVASAETTDAAPAGTMASAAPTAGGATGVGVDEAALRRIVDEALEKRLGPLNRKLAAMTEAGPSTSDVVGGIGWILGLFGIAAYFKSKRG